jgi:hypothetical protein
LEIGFVSYSFKSLGMRDVGDVPNNKFLVEVPKFFGI